jgi:hypothetical protein
MYEIMTIDLAEYQIAKIGTWVMRRDAAQSEIKFGTSYK